jgi:peptidylprolyl isomerase
MCDKKPVLVLHSFIMSDERKREVHIDHTFMVTEDSMKKSEKEKGKAAVTVRNKKIKQYAMVATAVLIVLAGILFYFFNPFFAKTGDTVAIYYTGTLDNGTVIDSNMNLTPFILTIGQTETIPYGLPDAVIGMQQNETKTVILPAEKAFGKYQPSLVQTVNLSSLPENTTLVVGQPYEIIRKSDNAVAHVKIVNITPTTVTWDGNSDLAGQNLTLKITLVQIVRK